MQQAPAVLKSNYWLFTEADKAVKSRKELLGVFIGQPFYMKLYDSIKGSHMNYKVLALANESCLHVEGKTGVIPYF